MNKILLTLFTATYILFSVSAQDSTPVFSKEDFIGTWRICYALNIEETGDTLEFQSATPGCRFDDCGEHQWSFREGGSVEFVFTKGCDTGFNSVSKNPKRWVYIEKENLLKFISNDGFLDVYTVEEITEATLTLVRRRDLE